ELTAFYLWLWRQLPTSYEQRLLERAGRLYKNSRWPSKEERCLFDKCVASSYKATSWAQHRVLGLEGAALLQAAIDRAQRKASIAQVVILIPGTHPRRVALKRHAALAASRESYNTEHGSYLNNARLSRTPREQRSLNIPRDPILVEKLEQDNEQAMRP